VSTQALKYILDFFVAFAAAAAAIAWWIANRKRIAAETVGKAEEQASRIMRDAEREADARRKEAVIEARERSHELRVEAEQFARDHRQQITGMEQLLVKREAALLEQTQALDERDKTLGGREDAIAAREEIVAKSAAEAEALVARQRRDLERIGGLTHGRGEGDARPPDGADARREAATLVKRIEAEARAGRRGARGIVTQAIQRSAADHTIETTVTVVDLPSDDMKGGSSAARGATSRARGRHRRRPDRRRHARRDHPLELDPYAAKWPSGRSSGSSPTDEFIPRASRRSSRRSRPKWTTLCARTARRRPSSWACTTSIPKCCG
jgi:ribonuclease Y